MSTFSSINTAMSGLLAQQTAIEVAGNNVANVNTPGYHRQEALFTARPALAVNSGAFSTARPLVGTGVEITAIRRMQTDFLMQQTRQTQSQVGYWDSAQTNLQQVESILSPGTGLGLTSMLDQFFNSWQQLANYPEDSGRREAVKAAAINLTTSLNLAAGQLHSLATDLDNQLIYKVDRLNTLADNLASINVQIGAASVSSAVGSVNGLLDERESILDEMASLVGISALSNDAGTSIVNINGHSLVQGTMANHLSLVQGPDGLQVVWEDGGAVNITSGEMGSIIDLRSQVLPEFEDQLDTIALALSSSVNAIHSTGVTADNALAGDFFTGTTAFSLRLSDDILADSNNISTTKEVNSPADGSLAMAIFNLNKQPLIGDKTLNQTAEGILMNIGNAVNGAKTNLAANSAVADQLFAIQQSAAGVSIDEEMANLLIHQRSYDASARVLRTADEMIQTLIGMMG